MFRKRITYIASALALLVISFAGGMAASESVTLAPFQAEPLNTAHDVQPAISTNENSNDDDDFQILDIRMVYRVIDFATVSETPSDANVIREFEYRTPRMLDDDNNVSFVANNFPQDIAIRTDNGFFSVIEDYNYYNGIPEKNVTDRSTYKDGIVSLPNDFKASDLSCIIYIDKENLNKEFPFNVNVTRTMDGDETYETITQSVRLSDEFLRIGNVLGGGIIQDDTPAVILTEDIPVDDYAYDGSDIIVKANVLSEGIDITIKQDDYDESIGINALSITPENQSAANELSDMIEQAREERAEMSSFSYIAMSSHPPISGTVHLSGFDPGQNIDPNSAYEHAKFNVDIVGGEVVRGDCKDHGHFFPLDGTYSFSGTWDESRQMYYCVVHSSYTVYSSDDVHPWDRPYWGNNSYGFDTQRVEFYWLPKGKIELTKKSIAPSLTNGNTNYSLANAVYGVYSDSGCTNMVAEMRTDGNGYARSEDLEANKTYYVKEKNAPLGYKLDPTVYHATVAPGSTVPIASTNGESIDDIQVGSLTITKKSTDERTTAKGAENYYSFDGIQYTLSSNEKVAGTQTSRYIYTITLNKYGAAKSVTLLANGSTLPYDGARKPYISDAANNKATVCNIIAGTYTIKETKDNSYYYLDPTPVSNITFSTTTLNQDAPNKSVSFSDEPRYASYILNKVTNDANADLSDYYNFKNCQYKLVGKNSGQVYYMTMCEGGYAQHGLPAKYQNCRYDCFTHYNGHQHNAYAGRVLKNGTTVYGDILYDDYTVTEVENNKYWKKNLVPWSVALTTTTTQASSVPKTETTTETPQYASVTIKKSSKDGNTENREPYYDFSGIKYRLTSEHVHNGGGEKDALGHLIYDITLDAKGNGSKSGMVFDTYHLTEIETNKYYLAKEGVTGSYRIDAANTVSGTQSYLVTAKDEPHKGSIKIVKTSTDERTLTNPNYNFDGIIYRATSHGVYENGKPKTYDIPLNAQGIGQVDDVIFDTYDIQEIQTNKWYKRDYKNYVDAVVVSSDNTNKGTVPVEFSTSDEPNCVKFDVYKTSNYQHLSFNNGAYSLAGATFEIRNTRTGEVTTTMTTNKVGYGVSEWIPYDDYKVVETSACLNHVIATNDFTYPRTSLTIGAIHTIGGNGGKQVPNEPGYIVPGFDFVQKVDKESESDVVPGESTIAKAVFEIAYYDTNDPKDIFKEGASPARTWYLATDANGHTDFQNVVPGDMTVTTKQDGQTVTRTFTSSEVYVKKNEPSVKVIPCGVFTVREVLNPEGYIFDNATHQGPGKLFTYHVTTDQTQSNPEISCDAFKTTTSDQNVRGDVEFVKFDQVTGLRMPGIPFQITAKATGESHVVTTGTSGVLKIQERYDAAPEKANVNDALLTTNENGEKVLSDESALDHSAGIFFIGYGPKNDPDGTKAAAAKPDANAFPMPYGTYIIEELPCLKNHARTLETTEVTITTHNQQHVIGDVFDKDMSIHTTATDQITGESIGSAVSENATIVDEVSYQNLTPGREYTLTGTLMDKATGKQLIDVAGNTFTKTETFVPTVSDSSYKMTFTVPMSILKGKAVVVYERLRDAQRDIAEHEDINDEGQTVRYAEIHTNAVDSQSGTHEGIATEETVQIIDTVTYENLLAGEEYEMKATLMDKQTGEPITDNNGQPITATRTFVANDVNGSVDVTISVSREFVAGKTTVAFEQLKLNGNVVATHEDIEDKDQTVEYPKIHTTATDRLTALHEGLVRENVVIDDVVTFTNLIKGQRYEVKGLLMDRESGQALTDESGNTYESKVVFVADADKGYVLAQSVNVVEAQEDENGKSNENGANNAAQDESENADAPNETPDVPSVDDNNNADENENADENANGNENGDDNGTAEETEPMAPIPTIDGTRVNGTVTVSFEVPGTLLAGKTTVVFEDLYIDLNQESSLTLDDDEQIKEEDKEIPEPTEIYKHEDLDDNEQTVWFPKIGTTATVDDSHVSQFVEKVELVDVVAYENLEAGQTYIVVGTLMDKNSESVLETEDGVPVTATTQFVPETGNGEISVNFTFDGTDMDSASTVVFEKLYKVVPVPAGETPDESDTPNDAPDNPNDDSDTPTENVLIATHEDFDDEGQSVYFAAYADSSKTEEILPESIPQAIISAVTAAGDGAVLCLLGAAVLTVSAAATLIIRRRTRR